ncbi:MAG: hypothetical protein KF830_09395 [Planctomycetes bacterium]|nr:hypothetical protein [Planctomycetota bacterium]
MRQLPIVAALFVAGGALAGWLVAGLLPPRPLDDELQVWTEDYRLERRQAEPFLVRDGTWLRVPRLFPDFDLQMDVELGPGMDLDLLVRHVEPRLVQRHKPPFTERFVVLRLTTLRDGPAWRTREEALFGERGSGSSLSPGLPATVWVEGRGRQLRANIAGRSTGWWQAEDTEGMFALVARGGTAALQRLSITNRGVPDAAWRRRGTWGLLGGLGGALAAAWAAWCGRGRLLSAVGFAVGVTGAAALLAATAPLAPLRMPPVAALLALLAAPIVTATGWLVAAAVRRRALAWALGLGLAPALGIGGVLVAHAGLRSDTRAVDRVFGARAGNTLSEALAGIVRGPFQLHNAADAQRGVFLLGGRLLYGRLGPDTEHLEPLLAGELRHRLGRAVPVVGLPTEEGQAHTQQQWELFTGFYTGYRPRVVVLGVAQTEGDVDPTTGTRRAWPSTLQATLAAAREHARAQGAALVLFTEAGLASDLFDVLQAAARDGVPFVVADAGEAAAAIAGRLAAAIAPWLEP